MAVLEKVREYFPIICEIGFVSGKVRVNFPAILSKIHPFLFFEWIRAISPSIQAIFHLIFEIREIFPVIYLVRTSLSDLFSMGIK